MTNIVVHDRRLEGVPPAGSIQVDETIPLNKLLSRLSGMRRISRLAIMCHGGHGETGDPRIMSVNDTGLLLCRENLTLNNVAQTRVLRGKVERIILYVCSPALTQSNNERGTARDGWLLCQSLATYTGAHVVASTVTQNYTRNFHNLWTRLTTEGVIDFGHWEGPLWEFAPGGGARRLQ